jgi:hypothetical protein
VKVTAAIAISVFRESVRDKVLYNLVFFAMLLMSSSYLIGQQTRGKDVKIIKDLGLGDLALGLFIAVFIGIDALEGGRAPLITPCWPSQSRADNWSSA